ncbi:MAG: SpoIIE family protein phosphatase [Ignavibacteria bacterium]|nr:SpoIIE family protein phosphatase [Ignavibacteria bacterium]
MRTIKLLCLLCYSFLTSISLFSQQNAALKLTSKDIEINGDSSKNGFTISGFWKYKSGDSLQWTSPAYSDESWDSLKSEFNVDSIPQNTWTGIGWFRLKILPNSSLKNQTVAFALLQSGASEIYVNGKLVKKFGTVSSINNEVTYNPRRMPFGVYFGNKDTILIAIKYSHSKYLSYLKQYGLYNDNPGFSLRISELDKAITTFNKYDIINTIIQVSLSGIILALGLIHFLIYFFHKKDKANLHYSLFAFSIMLMLAEGLIFRFITQHSSNIIFSVVNTVNILVIFLLLIRFLYIIHYGKVLRFFWLLVILSIGNIISGFFQKSEVVFFAFMVPVVVLSLVEGMRIVILGIRRKRTGAWIIGTGFSGFFLLVAFVLIINFTGNAKLVSIEWLLVILYSGFLSIPLSMSIYLARSFALTNKNLEIKLVEVKQLSDQAIEHERKEAEINLLREKEQLKLKESEIRAEALEKENERKAKELEQARQIQLSMLPSKIPQLPNLDIAVYMKTATEVGGDYYDFYIDNLRKLTIVIGDATGHGVKAGIMVTAIKSLFSAYADELNLLDMFTRFNRGIKEMNLGALYMCFSALKIKDYEMEYSNAGMPPMLIYRKDKKEVETISLKAMPLGAFADFPYKETVLSFSPGDTVLLLSDGFPELFSKKMEMIDYPQVEKYFINVAERSPEEIIKYLVQVVRDWREDDSLEDDVTFVVLKFK